jgi:hypothetical protein
VRYFRDYAPVHGAVARPRTWAFARLCHPAGRCPGWLRLGRNTKRHHGADRAEAPQENFFAKQRACPNAPQKYYPPPHRKIPGNAYLSLGFEQALSAIHFYPITVLFT